MLESCQKILFPHLEALQPLGKWRHTFLRFSCANAGPAGERADGHLIQPIEDAIWYLAT
jgi:hypothetical protein